LPLPLSNDAIRTGYEIEGHPVSDNDQPRTYMALAGNDYFRTMQIALLKGRLFSDADRADSTPVVIVDRELAEMAFPGENPIGKRIKPGVAASGEPPMREIVGVVANVKHHTLNSPDDAFSYVPMDQVPFDDVHGVVRSSLPMATLMPAIREQVAAIDPDIPIYAVKTMDDYVGESVAQPRLDSRLLGIFAGLALALAVIGIYGVMSYTVAQRTNEFGIRIALGAQAGDVRKLVLRQAMRIAGIGVAAGVIGAVVATRLLRTLLFGVQPGDPMTLAGVTLVLVACVLAACWVPAWRAMRVDPIVALRYE
jgi:putative ABC transport system permease protein